MRRLRYYVAGMGSAAALLLAATALSFQPPDLLLPQKLGEARYQVLARGGEALSVSYQARFNLLGHLSLHDVPELLRQAIVTSEDRRFFTHHGIDWQARAAALWQNVQAGRAVRGASTITEQVVRILNPRPRTLWSRWMEGWEALWLEAHASKGDILEFYVNQLPYAANRRGVAQAARYYFDRDMGTLTPKEMLALAVLPRAPGAWDLYRDPGRVEPAIARLAKALQAQGVLDDAAVLQLAAPLVLQPAGEPVEASHFIAYVRRNVPQPPGGMLVTTLDAGLQQKAQALLDARVAALAPKNVHNGAVLVADHATGEILAWAVAGAGSNAAAAAIDAVQAARQPGSSLKPFLYALALDSGWTAATVLYDEPMSEAIGSGLHDFHNYSHQFYGPVSLREALGNSLNIPALKAIAHVGAERYLGVLHRLGFTSLSQSADFYREGLALGNGEVTLLEMVQAYSALASRGVFRPLTPVRQPPYAGLSRQVYSEEAASLIGHILSDPFARRREFGAGSVLNLPVQTAVKTGTSNDYRDAWVLGYDAHYTVGVWMGNLSGEPMDGVTGALGPALVLRGMFAALSEMQPTRPLYLSPALEARQVCTQGQEGCFPHVEYFVPGTGEDVPPAQAENFALIRPSEGLLMAYDPRVPAEAQAFEFVARVGEEHAVEWRLNGELQQVTQGGSWLWPLTRGRHVLEAREVAGGRVLASDTAHFQVK